MGVQSNCCPKVSRAGKYPGAVHSKNLSVGHLKHFNQALAQELIAGQVTFCPQDVGMGYCKV